MHFPPLEEYYVFIFSQSNGDFDTLIKIPERSRITERLSFYFPHIVSPSQQFNLKARVKQSDGQM